MSPDLREGGYDWDVPPRTHLGWLSRWEKEKGYYVLRHSPRPEKGACGSYLLQEQRLLEEDLLGTLEGTKKNRAYSPLNARGREDGEALTFPGTKK